MNSLGKHLRTPGPHGHLPFHPQCSTCSEARLHGTIPVAPVVPTKIKASLATALVTVSASVTPAMSVAQEIDEETEGTELPQSPGPRGPDPGDETRVPGEESIPVPSIPGGDEADDADGPALESEPEVDSGRPRPTVEPMEPGPGSDTEETQPPPEQEPVAPAPQAPPSDVEERRPQRSERPARQRPLEPAPATPRPRVPERTSPPAAAPDLARPLEQTGSPADSATAGPPARPAPSRAVATVSRGQEHVVQPGESLWSIAAGLAGDDASPAKIARIVNRLWTLNADRIGTGNPDLVMAGTTLRIR